MQEIRAMKPNLYCFILAWSLRAVEKEQKGEVRILCLGLLWKKRRLHQPSIQCVMAQDVKGGYGVRSILNFII